jgi:hypothetical protein
VAAILALVLGKLWKPLAALLVAAGLLLGAYWMGYRSADQKALVAVLQAALDGAHKDLEAQKEATESAQTFASAETRTALEARDPAPKQRPRAGEDARAVLLREIARAEANERRLIQAQGSYLRILNTYR